MAVSCTGIISEIKRDIGQNSQFSYPLIPAFDVPVSGFPSESCHTVWCRKLEWWGYPTMKKFADIFSRFDVWRTDIFHMPSVSIASRCKMAWFKRTSYSFYDKVGDPCKLVMSSSFFSRLSSNNIFSIIDDYRVQVQVHVLSLTSPTRNCVRAFNCKPQYRTADRRSVSAL